MYRLQALFNSGYSATDIITTLFRVVRNTDMNEFLKLELIKVRLPETLRDTLSSAFTTPIPPPAAADLVG